MVTPELEKYIESERARGVADSALREALDSQGWAQEDISAVLPEKPAKATSPEKAKSDRIHDIILWIGVAVILAALGAGAYFYFSNRDQVDTPVVRSSPIVFTTGSPSPSPDASASPSPNPIPGTSITVSSQTTGKPVLSYTLPEGWNQEAYYPQATGGPIAAFPTERDKSVANLSIPSSPDVNSGKVFRSISGTVSDNKPAEALTAYDRFTNTNPHYDKVLLAEGSFSGGKYRCLQAKDGSALSVNCYASNGGILLNYVLHTDTANYEADLLAFYSVVESTKPLQ